MNAEWKAKWVEALRSGKYTQTKYRLKSADGSMCCMGVLCDVVNPNGWVGRDRQDFAESSTFPPHSVMQKTDLPTTREMGVLRLAAMNDKLGMSFSEIADWIEANL